MGRTLPVGSARAGYQDQFTHDKCIILFDRCMPLVGRLFDRCMPLVVLVGIESLELLNTYLRVFFSQGTLLDMFQSETKADSWLKFPMSTPFWPGHLHDHSRQPGWVLRLFGSAVYWTR